MVVGRVTAVFAVFYVCGVCFRKYLTPKELLFISWGGMIRGVIAFALVMKIPRRGTSSCDLDDQTDCFSEQNYELMVSTTLSIVIITTIVFGTFMTVA